MKKNIITVASIVALAAAAHAQQSLNFQAKPIVSPEVSANTATFRIQAPNAKEVKISGDWMPSRNWAPGMADMTKDSDGIWTYTAKDLPSELYNYSFFVDGLKITDPNNVYPMRDVGSIFNIFIIGGGQGDLYKVNDVPHGTLSYPWYKSESLKRERRMTVYTPPGYEDSTEKYPVLYLLHGMGGDERAWTTLGCAAQILDNLIASGKAKPMIVVMPNGHTANDATPGESSKGLRKPDMQDFRGNGFAGEMESSFKDIIKYVESHYRVKADKADRAIAGLSMGGMHSMVISANYENTFDYVGLFSAATGVASRTGSEMYSNFDEKLEKQNKNGCKLYWIGMGKTDFLYKNGEEFRAKLDKIGMKYDYRESEDGHIWRNWRIYLSEFVPQLFK